MSRDVKHGVVLEYSGTLKDFSDKVCGCGHGQKKQKHLKKKEVCDLSSCPIDGAYLTLSKIGGIVVLFHSPPGCNMGLWILWGGAYSLKSVTGTKKEAECITLHTNMNEEDVIYGGTEKLLKAVIDIKKRFNPGHVAILSSCCSGIIGDDLGQVVSHAREKLGMNIGWLDTAGFRSVYWPNGYDLAHQYIVDVMMEEPKGIDENTVNIVPYGNAARVDEVECGRLLTELGLNVQFPLSVPHTTVENIKKAPNARANLMMCLTFGWNFCKAMEKRFGTLYSPETHPIGIHFTKKWLLGAAKIFNKEKEAQKLIDKELEEIEKEYGELRRQLKGKSVAISAGHDKVTSLLATCLGFGMRISYIGVITYDNLVKDKIREVAAMFDYDIDLHVFPQTYEEIPMVKKFSPDVFIGPAGLTPKNVMMRMPAVSTHFNDFIGPYFGFKGVVNFGKEIIKAINDPLPHYAPFNYLLTGPERVCGQPWYKSYIERGKFE